MKIRAYLVLMACAILLPVTILLTIALTMLQEATRTEALRGLQETARATALAVDGELGSAEAALQVLASSTHLVNGDLADFHQQSKVADRNYGAWTVLFDTEGRQLINTIVPFGSTPQEPVAAERVAKVLQHDGTYISGLITGSVARRLVATVNVPVRLDDDRQYVLAKAFAADYFDRIFSSSPIPKTWVAEILDKEGRLIARSRNSGEFVGRPGSNTLIAAAASSSDGTVRVPLSDGVSAYAAFTHSSMGGWTVAVAAPVAAIEAPARRATRVATLGFVAALGCAVGAAFFFGRRLTHSIHHALDAAAALSRGQSPPCIDHGVVELDELHRAMRQTGDVLQTEMATRKQAEAKLAGLFAKEQNARQEAQLQNQRKDAFLAMLGHELRNPLAAISSASTVLHDEDARPDSHARARDVIRRQSGHLTRIVDDLLDLARFMSGKIQLDREHLDLAVLVRRCVDILCETGRTAQHEISVQTVQAPVRVDVTRIEQLVNNLLVNAIKYTPAGGQINVDLACGDTEAILTVRDSGIGMSSGLLPHVFQVFFQGPSSIDRSQGGLGIGLALVSQLAQLHGGTVDAASAGPGCGSTFTLRLPLARGSPADAVDAAQSETGDATVDATSRRRETPPGTVPEPEGAPVEAAGLQRPTEEIGPGSLPAAPLTSRKVVVIEDNDDGREMIALAMELRGHQVLMAAAGVEGISIALQNRPDVAVIDIGLPDLSGYEVARRLRADPATAKMFLIALTGYGQQEDHDRALANGFDRHFAKPVDIGQLLRTMEAIGESA